MTTTEEVIRLFHKAGELAGWKPGVGNPLVINYLTHFAELVKAEENEACAKVCDELHYEWNFGEISGPRQCAESIRAMRNHAAPSA